jgi:hypothetical protein
VSPAFPIVVISWLPKIALSVGPQFHVALEDAHQSPLTSDPVFANKRPSPLAVSDRCSVSGDTFQGRLLMEDAH